MLSSPPPPTPVKKKPKVQWNFNSQDFCDFSVLSEKVFHPVIQGIVLVHHAVDANCCETTDSYHCRDDSSNLRCLLNVGLLEESVDS